jgi:hypothetical protein
VWVEKGWNTDINLDLITDNRFYFGLSDTKLEIYAEPTRMSFLWQVIESNNLNKKQLYVLSVKRMT